MQSSHPVRRTPAAVVRHLRTAPMVLLALLALLASGAGAAPGTGSPPPGDAAAADAAVRPSVDAAQIQALLREAEASSQLPEETKKRLLEQYRAALANLEQVTANNGKAAEYRDSLNTAPRAAAAIRAEMAKTPPLADPPVTLPDGAGIAEVDGLLAREQAESATLEAQLAELDKELEAAGSEPGRLRQRLTEAKQALAALEPELGQSPATGLDAEQQAQRWVKETRRDLLSAEVRMLEQQMVSGDARRTLTEARRDQAQQELKRLRARRSFLENAMDHLRRAEAERIRAETDEAERAAADAHPLVRGQAEENAALAKTIERLTGDLDQLDDRQAAQELQLARIETDFRSARQRLAVAGVSRALGQVLIEQRRQLPDPRTLRRAAAERANAIAETTLAQIRYREELRQLDDMDAAAAELIAALPEAEQAKVGKKVRRQLREQLSRRADLLRRVLAVEDSYLRGLGELEYTSQRLLDTVQKYDAFLAERLLWVRSVEPVTAQDFGPLVQAVGWMVSPRNWLEVARVLGHELRHSPAFWLGLALVAALFARGPALRRAIRATAEPLRRINTDRFIYTVKGLVLTLLLAASWPLLLALLGWQLVFSLAGNAFTKAVGTGLIAITPALYYLRAFRLLCMPRGVGDLHFRWSGEALRMLRSNFDLAVYGLLPIGFVASAVFNQPNQAYSGTLARLAVVLFMLGFAALTARLLHPTRGALRNLLAAHPTGWANRLRGIWYPLVVGVPVILAGLNLAGYMYTAGTLLVAMINQLWLLLMLIIVQQSLVRWLVLTRRSLALKAVLDRRASREAQKDKDADTHTEAAPVADEPADLATLDSQTRRLVNALIVFAGAAGLWLIWSDVIPALGVLDRVELWSHTGLVDGVEQAVPVTLADLVLVLFILVVIVVAAVNLPALLEILLLKSSHVSAGSRYAVTTLTGYAITAIGALMVFGALGLSWGQVQWLVAALGVGIGFGLQEIVANFISGLIILFERPVRVGDTVTIGDTTGVVTRIQIRATTIRNYDRQELLVPNKEFITGRLLNWTLTDQINRIVIPIGVDYGTDTRKALALLGAVAAENPRVLKEPAPLLSFEGFGDNALTLVLRCYLDSIDYRLAVTTELHQAIDDKFNAHGIGIAYPQRDVHLRASEPLEIRLRRADDGPAHPAPAPSASSAPAAARGPDPAAT